MSRDIWYQFFSNCLIGFLAFFLNIGLARLLTVSEFGKYQYYIICGVFFSLLQDLGFKTLILRESAYKSQKIPIDTEELFSFAEIHLIITTTIFFFVCLILHDIKLLFVLIYYAFFVFSTWVSSYLRGKKFFKKEAILSFSLRFICIFFSLFFTFFFPSVFFALFGLVLGVLISMFILNKYFFPLPEKKSFLFSLYKFSLPFLIVDFFTTIYFRIDILMLEKIKNSLIVGYYSAGYRIYEAFIFLVTPIFFYYFVLIRKNILQQTKKIKKYILFGISISFSIALLLNFSYPLWGKFIIELLYGPSFIFSVSILKILSLSLLFVFPNYFLTQTLIAFEYEKFYAFTTILAAIINFSLNLYFIPQLGAIGAAWTTFITEGLLCILLLGGTFKWVLKSVS